MEGKDWGTFYHVTPRNYQVEPERLEDTFRHLVQLFEVEQQEALERGRH